MDKLKTILTLIAVILAALGLLAAIGLVYSLLSYLLLFAVLALGGYIAFRLFVKSDAGQISAPDPAKELKKVQRLLDQYKQKEDR